MVLEFPPLIFPHSSVTGYTDLIHFLFWVQKFNKFPWQLTSCYSQHISITNNSNRPNLTAVRVSFEYVAGECSDVIKYMLQELVWCFVL